VANLSDTLLTPHSQSSPPSPSPKRQRGEPESRFYPPTALRREGPGPSGVETHDREPVDSDHRLISAILSGSGSPVDPTTCRLGPCYFVIIARKKLKML
jgi:hypothetical protein